MVRDTPQQYGRALTWAAVIGATIGLVGPFVVFFVVNSFLN